MSLQLISPPAPDRSRVVLPLSIIPRKSIVLLQLIGLPVPTDSPLLLSSQIANQPREEASRICHQSVYPCPLVCSHTYWPHRHPAERSSIVLLPMIIVSKSIIVVFPPWISPPAELTLPSWPSFQAESWRKQSLLQLCFDWESYFQLITCQLVLRYYSPTTLPPGIFDRFSVDTLLLVPRTVLQAYLRFVTRYCVWHFFQGV